MFRVSAYVTSYKNGRDKAFLSSEPLTSLLKVYLNRKCSGRLFYLHFKVIITLRSVQFQNSVRDKVFGYAHQVNGTAITREFRRNEPTTSYFSHQSRILPQIYTCPTKKTLLDVHSLKILRQFFVNSLALLKYPDMAMDQNFTSKLSHPVHNNYS